MARPKTGSLDGCEGGGEVAGRDFGVGDLLDEEEGREGEVSR